MIKSKFKVLLLIGLATATILTSCSKDDDDPTPSGGGGTTYGTIRSYTATLLGGQSNSNGSFYSSSDNMVYTSTQTGADTALQRKTDLVYFYGTTNAATIAAPNDADAATAHNANSLPNWTITNATKFKTTSFTAAQFNASMNDSLAIAATTGADLTKANQLTVGQVVGFVTARGKKGIFSVTAIGGTDAATRTITINVKVQE